MKSYKVIPALILLIVLTTGPLLYFLIPQYYLTPDILYVKAKTMWVGNGDLYADPVTGFPTFHPPYYHLILSLFVRLGMGIDFLLIAVSLSNVILLTLFTFLILRQIFDSRTALVSVFLIPFIYEYMGPGNILLASSFSFSVPLYLAGLWLYTKKAPSLFQTVLTAILWGLAFLISPGYLFLIAFAFVYELIFKRHYSRVLIMAAVFIIVIIPFFHQAYTIRRFGMMESSAFALWRGVPDLDWLQSLVMQLVSRVDGSLMRWHILPMLCLTGFGLYGMWRLRPVHSFPAVAALAFLFTFYHFNPQYASRVLFFLSLFLAAYFVRLLLSIESRKILVIGLLAVFILLGLSDHDLRITRFYNKRMVRYTGYGQRVANIKEALKPFVEPGDFVLALAKTYRRYIMPYFLTHGLLAYKSGEYYQLNTTLAAEMLVDYNRLMLTDNPDQIEYYCNKYGIKIAVVNRLDKSPPVFAAIRQWWDEVYADDTFRIYRRPTGRTSLDARGS
jgi:hypothetical protein